MITAEFPTVDVQQRLIARFDEFAGLPSHAYQFCELEALNREVYNHPEVAPALVDYAARPGGSQLVRTFALSMGIGACARVVQDYERGKGEPPTPAQQEIYDTVRRLTSNYFEAPDPELTQVYEYGCNPPYFWFFQRLARSEGIDPRIIDPDPTELGFDYSTVSPNVPHAAISLLGRLMGGTDVLDINNLPPAVARDALELALDFRSDAYQQAVIAGEYPAVAQFARLWQLTKAGGFEHDVPLDDLYMSGSEGVAYAEALHGLSESVPLLADLYPWIPAEAITRGVRGLVANALFGLQHYRQNGNHIDTTIAFTGGMPIAVQEDNPLELINALTQAFREAHYAVTNYQPEFGQGNGDFHHCRFGDNVSYHGRAFGDEAFDPAHEFAGDATMRYRVQLDGAQQISFLNSEQTASTVGFRFDYDKFGLAFDVGAIRENPYTSHANDLEVRIGRFFALGNYLRCQQAGQDPTMNHVRGFQASAIDLAAGVLRQHQQLRQRALSPAGATALLASS